MLKVFGVDRSLASLEVLVGPKGMKLRLIKGMQSFLWELDGFPERFVASGKQALTLSPSFEIEFMCRWGDADVWGDFRQENPKTSSEWILLHINSSSWMEPVSLSLRNTEVANLTQIIMNYWFA
jgi:hypothetical protein